MWKNYLKLHFLVFIFGFTAILGKLIHVHPVGLVVYRTFFACIALWMILRFNKISYKIPLKDIIKLLLIGTILGAHWICFFGSARLSNVSISLVAISTMSFFTSIIEPIIHKKKFNFVEVAFGLMAIIGMVIIFKFEFQYINGLIVGLLGSILAAIFSLLNGQIGMRLNSSVISFYELLGAGILALCIIPFLPSIGVNNNILYLTDWDLLWLLILAIVCTAYPYAEMINLYKIFSVFTVNLSLNMEPIYGIIMAIIIFGQSEKMSVEFYIGGLLVFLSVILEPILNKKKA